MCLSNPALRDAVPSIFCSAERAVLSHLRRRSWRSFCCAGCTSSAARRAFLASRTNVVFSIPMLFFMGAASHFTVPSGGNHLAYWIGLFVLVALIEINALIATTGPTTKPIEKIPGVIVTGFVVWAIVYYGLVRALLAS